MVLSVIRSTFNLLGFASIRPVAALGNYILFIWESVRRILFPPVSGRLLIKQLEFVGNRSFWVIVLAGCMVGGVFGFQLGEIFRIFKAEGMLGAASGFALCKEMAPVVGSFLVTGRAGSAMAAEIATMRVNEQIDAMRVMAVNPYGYLVAPRILASMLVMPLLTGVFILAGVFISFIVGVTFFGVDVGVFFEKIQWIVGPQHVIQGLEKSVVFGFILSSVGCYKGFYAKGGAKGVGRATTEAVVVSLVTILVSDFFLSYLQM